MSTENFTGRIKNFLWPYMCHQKMPSLYRWREENGIFSIEWQPNKRCTLLASNLKGTAKGTGSSKIFSSVPRSFGKELVPVQFLPKGTSYMKLSSFCQFLTMFARDQLRGKWPTVNWDLNHFQLNKTCRDPQYHLWWKLIPVLLTRVNETCHGGARFKWCQNSREKSHSKAICLLVLPRREVVTPCSKFVFKVGKIQYYFLPNNCIVFMRHDA